MPNRYCLVGRPLPSCFWDSISSIKLESRSCCKIRLQLRLDDADIKVIDARQGLHDEFGEYAPGNLAMSKSLKALPEPSGLLLSGWMNGRKLTRRDEVFDNMRWLKAKFDTTPGRHKLRVIMVDPEIVLQQIVVNPDNNHYSYFGANKSTK